MVMNLGVFDINIAGKTGSVTVYAYDQNNTEFMKTFALGTG